MTRTVVMFAKAPEPGKVKTRLAASIGDERAAGLHAAFIADIGATVASVEGRHVLAWSGDPDHPAFAPLRELDYDFMPQPEGDLGQRLDRAMRREANRADAVVIIGSDSPTLMAEHLEDAFQKLQRASVVLGPSFDGGYYLIGVRSQWYLDLAPDDAVHPLFDEVSWSTADVLDQTLRRCRQMSCLCDLTAFWYDVDTIEDLNLLKTHLLEHLRPSGRDLAGNTAKLLTEANEEQTPATPTR